MAQNSLFYQGAELWMTTGGSPSTFAMVPRVQNVSVGFQVPRSNVPIIGRVKPLNQRPVINYVPVSLSCEYVKGDKSMEYNLGLLNPSGIAVTQGLLPDVSTTGVQNFQVLLAPNSSSSYAGQINVWSGVLNSFSLAGSVGDPVKGSFSMDCLDRNQVANNSARVAPSYNAQLIKNENITLTGIDFTGVGYSGVVIQSFKLDVNFQRVSTLRLGEKYPVRRLTEAVATLSLQGFLEGVTLSPGLSGFDCGNFQAGNIGLSLLPSCSSEPATVITMTNPYVESSNLGVQVGNYISVDISYSVPLSFVSSEASSGSNLTIS